MKLETLHTCLQNRTSVRKLPAIRVWSGPNTGRFGGRMMKVLWVEDHPRAGELLAAAAAAASRKRYGIDLVIATSLMDAERKLRLERFDLVVIDLMLPDSVDEDVTVTRIANMGKFRVAVVSASERRQQVVESLMRAGVDCARSRNRHPGHAGPGPRRATSVHHWPG